jgi:hypothetical protein
VHRTGCETGFLPNERLAKTPLLIKGLEARDPTLNLQNLKKTDSFIHWS